jgi:hypothetical protein
VINFADGKIASFSTNDARIEPRDIVW